VLPALVLVAVAARSYQPFGGDGEGERIAWTPFFDSVFTVVVVLVGLALIVAVWAWLHAIRTQRGGRGARSPYASLLVFLGIVLFCAIASRNILEYKRRPASSEGLEPAFPQQLPTQEARQTDYPRDPQFIWPLAIGVAVLIAAAIVAGVLIERRRRRRRDVRTPEQLEQLGKALDEAIDDLRRDPDPRRAVIAAYARMEQALTVFGLPRKPAEAPYEYLHRVARELEAEGPVEALTELFEVAKFSEHAVDERMRGRAIDALTAVRTEVRTAAAT
jgi:uncharacterized membrane protein YidH (DUF202 family)